jgi:hypothetical protein
LKVITFNIPGAAFATSDGAAGDEGAGLEGPPQQSGKPNSNTSIARRIAERPGCEHRASAID